MTATSLPDDYVHYAQARSLTVREWARLQTFPDWYVFKGPRTTGGRRRAGDPSSKNWDREVPKYTQIGNAVPVQARGVDWSSYRDKISWQTVVSHGSLMRTLSQREANLLLILQGSGLEFSILQVTATALRKGYTDATDPSTIF